MPFSFYFFTSLPQKVPIIENSVCQDMFEHAGHKKKILPSFLCAGYANGQKDSCEVSSIELLLPFSFDIMLIFLSFPSLLTGVRKRNENFGLRVN
jgi:hypothetical protein